MNPGNEDSDIDGIKAIWFDVGKDRFEKLREDVLNYFNTLKKKKEEDLKREENEDLKKKGSKMGLKKKEKKGLKKKEKKEEDLKREENEGLKKTENDDRPMTIKYPGYFYIILTNKVDTDYELAIWIEHLDMYITGTRSRKEGKWHGNWVEFNHTEFNYIDRKEVVCSKIQGADRYKFGIKYVDMYDCIMDEPILDKEKRRIRSDLYLAEFVLIGRESLKDVINFLPFLDDHSCAEQARKAAKCMTNLCVIVCECLRFKPLYQKACLAFQSEENIPVGEGDVPLLWLWGSGSKVYNLCKKDPKNDCLNKIIDALPVTTPAEIMNLIGQEIEIFLYANEVVGASSFTKRFLESYLALKQARWIEVMRANMDNLLLEGEDMEQLRAAKEALHVSTAPKTVVCSDPTDMEQLRAAKEALHVSTAPKTVVCREDEQTRILDFCKKCIQQEKAGSLYMCGCPGTGKSLLMEKVKDILVDWANEEDVETPDILSINCTSLTNTSEIFSKILGQSQDNRSTSLQLLQNLYSQKQSPGMKMTLVLADELDYLITKDRAVLDDLFMLTTFPFSKCILIGIGNAIDLADRFIPKLQSLNCKPVVITFNAYSKDQIIAIIQERLRKLPYTVFQPQAVELCARRVAAASGDLRKALSVCRSAIEMLEAERREPISDLMTSPLDRTGVQQMSAAHEMPTNKKNNMVRIDHVDAALSSVEIQIQNVQSFSK